VLCKGLNTAWIPKPFTTLIGGKGLPPYLYVGRHPHADRRGLQPASADALSGGKGLPPYFKAFFIFQHKTMNRRKSVKKKWQPDCNLTGTLAKSATVRLNMNCYI